MKPYYEDGSVVIFHADCRDVEWSADVLVTDPPYGVGLGGTAGAGGKHGLVRGAYATYDDSYENYVESIVPVIEDLLGVVKRGAVFSGPHLQELPKAAAIGGIYCPAGAGRHPWGFKTFLPLMLYGTYPMLQKGARPNVIQSTARAEENGHPCPKPLSWMRWVVELVSLPGEVVIDPFMGSGTTLRAAKDCGRRAVGIDLDERYCEIAARRMGQEVFDLGEAA